MGSAENCVLVGFVQFLDKVVVPVGATSGAWVRMLGSTVDTSSASVHGGLYGRFPLMFST